MATVSMLALRYHTYEGIPREPGSTYDAEEADVVTLKSQCMAVEASIVPPPPEPPPVQR